MRGKITNMLGEGFALKKIAKLTGKSYISIYKKAKKYERMGIIEQIAKYPLTYKKKKLILPPLKPVGDFTPPTKQPAIILPKKFGATFYQIGRPNLKYDNYGKATIEEIDHTIQFGRHKTQIWIKAFIGSNPDECMANAPKQIIGLAEQYSQKYGIKLTLDRIYEDVEWIVVSKQASKQMAEKAGISKGGQIRVGDATHKFGDFSEPENFQFNTAPDANNRREATDHAKTHQYLYTRLPFDMESIAKTMKATSDAVISIKTGQEVLVNELKKRGIL